MGRASGAYGWFPEGAGAGDGGVCVEADRARALSTERTSKTSAAPTSRPPIPSARFLCTPWRWRW